MLHALFKGWASKRYAKEAETLIQHLRSLRDRDVGLVLAIAIHHRNKLIETGAGMNDLSALAKAQPMYQHELAKAVNVLTRESRQQDDLGLQVWVHSLRAAADPAVWPAGKTLWQELSRGRQHIDAAAKAVRKETGFELDTSNAEAPREFS